MKDVPPPLLAGREVKLRVIRCSTCTKPKWKQHRKESGFYTRLRIKGAAHPATGHAYSENVLVCWRCTLETWAWLQTFTNQKGRRKGLSFYAHVRPPEKEEAPK